MNQSRSRHTEIENYVTVKQFVSILITVVVTTVGTQFGMFYYFASGIKADANIMIEKFEQDTKEWKAEHISRKHQNAIGYREFDQLKDMVSSINAKMDDIYGTLSQLGR